MVGVTLLDGGMGRELFRIGAPFRQPEWSALALTEGPEWVVQAHRNFLEAGARVITTNSYAIVPFHIGDDRFRNEGRDLAALAGRLAREAADAFVGSSVAGSLPPLFGSYRPDLFDPAVAPDIIDPLVDGLREYVDIWLGETLGSIAEAAEVRAALDRADLSGEPLWISYYLHDRRAGELASGEPIADAVSAAIDLGASAVMFNCSEAEAISAAIPVAMDTAAGRAQVGGYANRFSAAHTDTGAANDRLSDLRDDLDPTRYCDLTAGWLRDGATIVGGCCGITPDHIAAISEMLAGP